MISTQQLLDALVHECNVCKHLYTKFSPETLDYRPTEGQRSTLELLRYLSICGSASMHVMLHDSDWKQWKVYTGDMMQMKAEDFPAAMDKQVDEMTRMLLSIPEEDFLTKEVKHPTGEVMTLGLGLIRMSLAWLTAYKMQLFLYAKQSGDATINTSNAWVGADRK